MGSETTGSLAALARAHRAEGDAERDSQLRILDFLARAERPLDREVFDPGHVTGSAFVVSEDGRAALVHHAKLRLWVQPGGHAETGETDVSAVAAREASEELGLAVAPGGLELYDLDVHAIAPRGEVPRHLHFDFRFLAVVPRDAELAAGSDALEAGWFTRSQLAAIGLDSGMRRMADKAVARGLLRRD